MNNIRILYDYQIFLRQKYGGISRYFIELSKCMNSYDYVNAEIYTLAQINHYLEEEYGVKRYDYTNKYFRYVCMIINDIFTSIRIIKADWTGKAYDIVHLTWYKSFYLKIINKLCKRMPLIVITIHDLIHQMEMDKNKIYRRGARDISKMLEYADIIIAISENTKSDIMKYYPKISPERIHVIYHGAMKKRKEMPLETRSENIVLFVGKRDGYKNFYVFLNALALVKKKIDDLHIICVGGGKFTLEENERIKKLGLEFNIRQKSMSDEELISCYNKASCFVFPSLYEGFGLPILEAFQNGCPTILSNKSCFPEIAGDAAVYFDGYSAKELSEKIIDFCSSVEKRILYSKKGYEKSNNFSWETTTKKTLEVYKSYLVLRR